MSMSKRTESEARLPRRSSTPNSPELDVVNLSCQLISMELRPEEKQQKGVSKDLSSSSSQQLGSSASPAKGRKRKMTQKVRFDVPEDIEEKKTKSASKRCRSPSPGCTRKKKVAVRTNIYTKVMWKNKACVDALAGLSGHAHHSTNAALLLAKDSLTIVSEQRSSEIEPSIEQSAKKPRTSGLTDVSRVVLDRNNNVYANLNDNCSSTYKVKLGAKGKNVPLRKSQSDPLAYRKKINKYVKKARVVSKKHGLKSTKPTKGVKRKRRDIHCSGDDNGKKPSKKKRRHSSDSKHKSKKRPTKVKSYKSKSSSQIKIRKTTRSSSYKAKKLSVKMKKAAEKVKKAKELKLKKRLKLLRKRSANKKAALKKKTCIKTKHCKRSNRSKKKKTVGRSKPRDPRTICKCHGNRKLKIKPIKRNDEYEVIPPLRVSFLKYVTLKEAYAGDRLKCCRRFCFDKWPDMDMDTIIDDYE